MLLVKIGKVQEVNALLEEIKKDDVDYLLRILFSLPFAFSGDEQIKVDKILSSSKVVKELKAVAFGYDCFDEVQQLCNECATALLERMTEAKKVAYSVLEIIENEFSDEKLSLFRVAHRLNISHGHLSSLIKRELGRNFKELLTEKRMKKAYNLTVATDLKVFEIAKTCGFSDQYYFSFSFKKYYGISPQNLREKLHIS